MSDIQRDAYDGKKAVHSDPFGLWSRDNRNHRKKQELILEATHADAGDDVLEVGCGHGIHAPQYAEQFCYTGIDLIESLVAEARHRATRADADAVVQQMDATALEYEPDSFDAVVGTAVLHHLADQSGALREWQRVTRSGGSITLMEPNYLFPKDLITAHTVPEERHKTGMAPWRLRDTLDDIADEWKLTPCIYTPPWPAPLTPVYDQVDASMQDVPGARWLSQMLRIHVVC